jgi:hypothetical protein
MNKLNESLAGVNNGIGPEDLANVKALLGRTPRGLAAINVRTKTGFPVVIQVESIVNKKPFPTLFWLVDKQLNYSIDKLEAGGLIARLQKSIDASDELQLALKRDHEAHIALRTELMLPAHKEELNSLGFAEVFENRGIGGIENFTRIRCLHTYYAAHLVEPNTIGRLLDEYWDERGISFKHF